MHPVIENLIKCIRLEEKEQVIRYRLDQQHTLRQLKAEGLALHPLIITRKSFGYADYPEISFRLSFPPEASLFRDNAAIECFFQGEEPVKGVLLNLDGMQGEFRLFAPDYPDWLEEDGVGIKLSPDTRTTSIMISVMEELEKNKPLFRLFEQLHGAKNPGQPILGLNREKISFHNNDLNPSQREAIAGILDNEEICIIHGPPGTGKTTTLVEAITQLVTKGEKILVSAPSNTAVDHLVRSLVRWNIPVLRVGNTSKADPAILAHTPEGKLAASKEQQKQIKQLKMRAEEFRRMALKYKRSFGKAEREQRNLLFKEVKQLRAEIRQLQEYHEEKLFSEAAVIAGTPIGLYDAGLEKMKFDSLFIDEAGQCIEPLAWCIFPLAEKIVLAGDHWQLPPTVLSHEATRLGLNHSILEVAIAHGISSFLLDTQYRMRPTIAGFSSAYFYNNLLQTAGHLHDQGTHLVFIDTAGAGLEEKQGTDGVSLQNPGELSIIRQWVEQEAIDPDRTAFISPYSGQVQAAREVFPGSLRMSTIDSFQGQEMDTILLSLVRSNEESEIGFLKDYRRMNVAITRAKERLVVVGDSATIGADPFYRSFLEYIAKQGSYRTAWEFNL